MIMKDPPLAFNYRTHQVDVVFRPGVHRALAEPVGRLNCRRPFIVTTAHLAGRAEAIARHADPVECELFTQAEIHTPVEVTEMALAKLHGFGADCIVSLGGGSSTGLGKALSWRTMLPQIAIPTTYAGSEVTDILGETNRGRKTTFRDPRIVPKIVLYDSTLTLDFPLKLTVTSGLNAMAHAAEALYAADRNPISTMVATEGLRAFRDGLPAIVNEPHDPSARESLLYGAWLCGTVLGMVDMALHHKICHTLGGSFNLPHAETHTVMLPHTIDYNAASAGALLDPIAEMFGGPPGPSLYDFCRSLDAPMSLRDLGMAKKDLDKVAQIASERPYPNPRSIERPALKAMLQRAWEGTPPQY